MTEVQNSDDIAGFFRQMHPRSSSADGFQFDGVEGARRQFGGITLAQAIVAASQTVEEMVPHEIHILFLRPQIPGREIAYTVDRLRDGRRFCTRRVRALEGEAL